MVINMLSQMSTDQVPKTQRVTRDPIRVLIVDGQILIRAGIRLLLERLPNLEVIAEANDGLEALSLVAEYEPQIIIIELAMPDANGFEVIERLAKSHPNTKVIVLSIYSDEENVGQALRAGVAGYLFKDTSMDELEVAIRSIARGETYLSPQVSKPIIAEYLRLGGIAHPAEILSIRQRQVLELIAEGKNTKEIALTLNISVKTVETHRAKLMQRLEIHDVAGLVRYAIKTGLANID
jgi:DNA-binding NarL/FixJ family response regulator